MSFPFPRPFPGPSAMVSYSVLSLFMSGEQGAWYDPSDFSTMFQDSAGTTPVTAVEQPVGLILDKSKGLALGSELVTNGTFATDITGWTNAAPASGNISWSSGALLIERVTAGTTAYQAVTCVVGATYKVDYAFTPVTGGLLRISATNNTAVPGSGTTTPNSGSFYFVATATTMYIHLGLNSGNGTSGTYDNISVKELPGNHASQSTSASRPVLSARVNLLTYTEQFDNAAWVKTNASITQTNATAPNGTSTADLLTEASDTGVLHSTTISSATLMQGQHTFSVCVKANGRDWVLLNFAVSNGTYSISDARAWFNVSSGSVGTVGGTGASATITSLGSGWYRCTLFSTAYVSAVNRKVLVATATSDGSTSNDGDGTSGIYLWGADLRVTNDGVGIPAYQRVGAAVTATTNPAVTGVPDYDTSGFPLYLRFDGTDDSLATASIDFSATDKMSVFAGVRKLSDAAVSGGMVAEISIGSGTNPGSFYLDAPDSAAPNYGWKSRGSVNAATVIAASYAAPITNVLAGIGDISGDLATLRINGTQAAQSTTDQGTGNFGNYPLYIGRRGGATLPYNGRLYSLIVRGAQSTDAQIASTETWVDGKTGAY